MQYHLHKAGASRGFSTFASVHTPAAALLRNDVIRPARAGNGFSHSRSLHSAIRCAQRGDLRRRFLGTAGAIAMSAFFFTTCMMQVSANSIQMNGLNHGKSALQLGINGYEGSYNSSNNNRILFRGGDIDQDLFDYSLKPTPPIDFAHGTTTLSFVFQGGIVAAVDSRAR